MEIEEIDEEVWANKTREVRAYPRGTVAIGGSDCAWTKVDGPKPWHGPNGQELSDLGVALRLLDGRMTLEE